MFSFFQINRNSHLRRAMALLDEAHMARLEHQAAAEHHAALARMYGERAKRLEREIYGSAHQSLLESAAATPKVVSHEKPAIEKPAIYALGGGRPETKIS